MKAPNNIEKYFELQLNQKNILYQREFYLTGTHKNKKYDFFLTNFNTLIELDGPLHYAPSQILRDKKYTKLAKQKGFKIIRIEAEKKYIDQFIPLISKNKKSHLFGSEDFKQKFMSISQILFYKIRSLFCSSSYK